MGKITKTTWEMGGGRGRSHGEHASSLHRRGIKYLMTQNFKKIYFLWLFLSSNSNTVYIFGSHYFPKTSSFLEDCLFFHSHNYESSHQILQTYHSFASLDLYLKKKKKKSPFPQFSTCLNYIVHLPLSLYRPEN